MIRYLEDKSIPQRLKINARKIGVPAASLLAYQFGEFVTIEQILVFEEYRRLGIATHMITLLETWARENYATKIVGLLPICDVSSTQDIKTNYEFFQSRGYKHPLGILIYKNLAIQGS